MKLYCLNWVRFHELYAMLVGNQISLIDEFLRNDNFTCSFTKKIKNFLPFFLVFFPKVKVYKLPARYNYDMSTTISMSSKNLLRDPFEQQTVYIGQSQIHPEAGEGLFAKRHSVRFCLFFYPLQNMPLWKIIIKQDDTKN